MGHLGARPGLGAACTTWLDDTRLASRSSPARVSATGRTILTAGIVLAVMVLPIITAICREVFLQTPKLHEEAALALGATRWEMIRMAVLPFGRSGIVSAAMLGLGRALGETMAVAMVLSVVRRRHVQPDQLDQPVDDRREHRAEVPRGQRARGQRADRHGPGAVRHHVRWSTSIARWIVNRRSEFSGAN